jgi:hypothetical protein
MPDEIKDELMVFEQWDRKNSPPENAVLFLGDESVAEWATRKMFLQFPVINRGICGLTVADLMQYSQQLIIPYRPGAIVISVGCHDLVSAAYSLEVMQSYLHCLERIHDLVPDCPVVILSVPPRYLPDAVQSLGHELPEHLEVLCAADSRRYYLPMATYPNIEGEGKRDRRRYCFTDGACRALSDLLRSLISKETESVQRQDLPLQSVETSSIDYIASKQSKVFHRSDCPFAGRISQANRVTFKTRQDAVDSGRRPCRTCSP